MLDDITRSVNMCIKMLYKSICKSKLEAYCVLSETIVVHNSMGSQKLAAWTIINDLRPAKDDVKLYILYWVHIWINILNSVIIKKN